MVELYCKVTIGYHPRWDNATKTLRAGLLGSIAEIPAAYTSETMLFLGSAEPAGCAPFPCGPGAAVRNWGAALRRYKGKDTGFPAGGWEADPTLAYLGYYSDNGAYYYYYTGPDPENYPAPGPDPGQNFGAAFAAVKRVEVEQKGIPMRYLQVGRSVRCC